MEDNNPKKQSSIGPDVADAEFNRFAYEMDLDVDEKFMSAEEKDSFAQSKRRITRAIEQGRLVISEDGEPVFTTMEGQKLTFREPTGASYREMDKVSLKEGAEVAKLYRLMGSMTNVGPVPFTNMRGRDLKICMAIAGFFSA